MADASIAQWVAASGTAATGLATLIGGWVAIRGIDAWQAEVVGRRKAELAEEVLSQFYRARDALIWARLPDHPAFETEIGNARSEERDRRHRSLVSPIERLTEESQLFSELQASRYRFMAYFGEEAARPFDAIRAIRNEVVSSAQALIHHRGGGDADRDRWEDAIGQGGAEDELSRRLAETISSVERICRPLIAEEHRRRRRRQRP
jgi:hypothetical protein